MIEDSPAYRSAIEAALAEVPEAELVGMAETASDGIRLVEQAEPDLVLTDIFLKQGTGLDVLAHYQNRPKPPQFACMTNAPSTELQHHCRALGAASFHDKADGFEWIATLATRTNL